MLDKLKKELKKKKDEYEKSQLELKKKKELHSEVYNRYQDALALVKQEEALQEQKKKDEKKKPFIDMIEEKLIKCSFKKTIPNLIRECFVEIKKDNKSYKYHKDNIVKLRKLEKLSCRQMAEHFFFNMTYWRRIKTREYIKEINNIDFGNYREFMPRHWKKFK